MANMFADGAATRPRTGGTKNTKVTGLPTGGSMVGAGDFLVPKQPIVAAQPSLESIARYVSSTPRVTAVAPMTQPAAVLPVGAGVAGGVGVNPAPVAPVVPVVAGEPAAPGPEAETTAPPGASTGDPTLDQLNADEIAAMLAAIQAQTGLTEAQLLAAGDEIGMTYRMLTAQYQLQAARARRDSESAFADRGLARSGLFAKDQAGIERSLMAQTDEAARSTGNQQAGIKKELELLPFQQAAAEAAAQTRNQQAVLEYLQQIAALAG